MQISKKKNRWNSWKNSSIGRDLTVSHAIPSLQGNSYSILIRLKRAQKKGVKWPGKTRT